MQPFLFNLLLASGVQIHTSSAFITTPSSNLVMPRRCQRITISPRTQILHARDEDDKEDFVYAGRSRGRRDREEGGGYYDIDSPSSSYSSSSSSSRYQDNVEFFDLDDDDDDELFDDDFDDDKLDEMTYNGIIPNPLLDAMDPDGVYERLGPELFKDWTFFRDMALFAIFLALFTRDTHHYGTFDSVIEGLEKLPADFIH